MDLRSGYHQLKIEKEHVPKTTFRTRYYHYEFLGWPFGLANGPTFFMDLMNQVFKPYPDKFVVVFMDDVLGYSISKEGYAEHLCIVLKALEEYKLYAKFKKCDFWMEKVHFV